MKTTDEWLSGIEFEKFLEVGNNVFETLLNLENSYESEKMQALMLEMGSRYNHFIIQITEDAIADLKKQGLKDSVISKEVLEKIKIIEEEALDFYPKIMKLFFAYRNKVKEV